MTAAPRCELTVVVPVRNEARYIAALLEQFRRQTLPMDRYEIIVVDGLSEDDTCALVRAAMPLMPNLRLLSNPKIRSGPARNVGAYAAAAPFVLFVDGHCRLLSARMLERALTAFLNGERCLSRPQPLICEDLTPFQQAVAAARHSWLGHYAGSRIYANADTHTDPTSAGCGYTVELYRAVGGVDESFDACEDLEFNHRVASLGILALHAEEFAVGYAPRPTLRGLARQMYRYGFGRGRFARKHVGRISVLTACLGLFTAGIVLLPVALLLGRPFLFAWLGAYGSYALLTGATAVVIGRRLGLRGIARTWACFAAIHCGGGWGYLRGLAGGRPRSTTRAVSATHRDGTEACMSARTTHHD